METTFHHVDEMKCKTEYASKSMLRIIFAAFFLSCSVAACDPIEKGEGTMINRADEVKIGMTRDQVVEILGPVEFSTTPPGFPPDCDSWGYDVNGLRKYIVVRYRFDIPDDSTEPRTVISVSDNQEEHCFIE